MRTTNAIAMLCGAALVFTALPAQARDAKPLENVSLGYKAVNLSQVTTYELDALKTAKIKFDKFVDTRADKNKIAKNIEKGGEKWVTTQEDMGAWCRDSMAKMFKELGFDVVDSGETVVVKGEVLDFFVTESNTYQGKIAIKLTFTNKAGKVLWTGVADGNSTKFGRSYKLENYVETFSGSMAEALKALFVKADFKAAFKSGK